MGTPYSSAGEMLTVRPRQMASPAPGQGAARGWRRGRWRRRPPRIRSCRWGRPPAERCPGTAAPRPTRAEESTAPRPRRAIVGKRRPHQQLGHDAAVGRGRLLGLRAGRGHRGRRPHGVQRVREVDVDLVIALRAAELAEVSARVFEILQLLTDESLSDESIARQQLEEQEAASRVAQRSLQRDQECRDAAKMKEHWELDRKYR